MTSRVVHFEIPIDKPDRAGTSYQNVFGWNVAKWGPVDYWTMTAGAAPGPGAEGALTPRAEAPEGVVVYVGVEDIDHALRSIQDAGGTVLTDKMPIPTTGWSHPVVWRVAPDHRPSPACWTGRADGSTGVHYPTTGLHPIGAAPVSVMTTRQRLAR